MLSCKGLTKSYGPALVLRDVSMQLKPGDLKVLMGHSGCGKTTLLRTLSLLELADAGSVSIDDVTVSFPLRERNLDEIGSSVYPRIVLVFQQLFLWPNLTCLDNLLIVDPSHSRIMSFAERLGVQEILRRFPQECSLGQKQRIAVIRAILANPKYLLCDEITSALDRQSSVRLMELLVELVAEGMSILLITHDSGLLPLLGSPDVLRMERGSLLAEFATKAAALSGRSTFREAGQGV